MLYWHQPHTAGPIVRLQPGEAAALVAAGRRQRREWIKRAMAGDA